jgi:hypothetical protein
MVETSIEALGNLENNNVFEARVTVDVVFVDVHNSNMPVWHWIVFPRFVSFKQH